MTFDQIQIKAADGPVSVTVSVPNNPELITGKVFQFSATKTLEGVVGVFDFEHKDLLLGMPPLINGKLFAVRGLAIPLKNAMPVSYQVIVDVQQNGKSIFKEVPKAGGAGTLTDEEVEFLYGFTLTV